MNSVTILAAAAGAILVTGLVVGVMAFRPAPGPARPPGWLVTVGNRLLRGGGRTVADQRRYQLVAGASIVAGAGAWLLTGLPVLGLIAAATVPGVPWLLAGGRAERRAIERVEAIGEWTRRLRDVAGAGAGLQSAIISAATTAPPAIENQARLLAARLQAGWHGPDALRAFADEIDDSVCDQIVAALLLHLRDRGERLGAVLTAISEAAAKEVRMRKEADAERASARFSIRFMVWLSVAVVVVASLSGDYMAPYGTPAGQVLMLILAGIFVALLLWVRAMTRPARAPRLLGPPERGATR
ncbi:MAG TPA: type II secretion system F family protein [Natronosporangium sp.]